jgi:hypothetical protein
MCPDSSFDELLKVVIMNDQLACDQDVGGCGKPNHIHHILSTPPHVFTVGKPFLALGYFRLQLFCMYFHVQSCCCLMNI